MKTLSLPLPARRRSLWSALGQALTLHRSRRDLRDLDAHILRDIGLTPQEAAAEAARPIWDAPAHWLGR